MRGFKILKVLQDCRISHCICKEICLKFIPKVVLKLRIPLIFLKVKMAIWPWLPNKMYDWPLKMFGRIHECHQPFNSGQRSLGRELGYSGENSVLTLTAASLQSTFLMPWISGCHGVLCFERHELERWGKNIWNPFSRLIRE